MQNNDIFNELGQNFIEYAVAVNTDRAIPDARSGLKPVARRILYGAFNEGFSSNKPHIKCANIVGNVMAKFHPHGDSSIYDALTRLSQPWVMRYPLIDWHGNNGNRDGDPAASYRYTEARLSKLSEKGLLANIRKNTVDFVPNYSETEDEPVTLPAIFPNLLCNPNTGIGVAIACNWLPHNLKEVAQAIYDYVDGKEPMIPGPDFPTGGLIINGNDLPNIIRTGRGSVKIRGKYNIENNNIVFYEIPYGTGTEDLMNEIGTACDEERIHGVTNIRNESNRKKGFRLVIECDKNANMATIIASLFKETSLQTSISYNQVALVDKTPTELGLKDCIKIYIDHNVSCITREANFDKAKAEARLHIVDGLIKALENIDDIISLIKSADSSAEAKVKLISKYGFSEEQAKAILDMKLSRLAKLEKIELEEEKAKLHAWIEELLAILQNPVAEVIKRLKDIVATFGDDRRTEITQIAKETDEEKKLAFVEPEKCVVVMTQNGLIKRIPTASFKTQHKGGKGVKSQADIVSAVIRTNTIDSLMIFSDKGKMYRLLVDDVPSGTNASKGTPVKALITMESDENPSVIYSIYRDTDAKYMLFVTKNGMVKKTALSEYVETKKKTGVAAISLKENDELVVATLIKDGPLIIASKNGNVIKFNSNEIAATSRNTSGVKGINLNDEDYVIAALPLRDPADALALFSSKGYGKRIEQKDLLPQKRGGKGVNCFKAGLLTGELAGAQLVNDDDNVLILGNKSSLCMSASEIPIVSKASTGSIMLKDNKILGVSKV